MSAHEDDASTPCEYCGVTFDIHEQLGCKPMPHPPHQEPEKGETQKLAEQAAWPRTQTLLGLCSCCGVEFRTTLLAANEAERDAMWATHSASVVEHSKACWGKALQSAAQAARKEALEPGNWRPIETAPKDGAWVWMLHKTTGKTDSHITVSAFKWDTSHRGEEGSGMWFAGNGWWYAIPNGYTHWAPMTSQPPEPLASPPQSKER